MSKSIHWLIPAAACALFGGAMVGCEEPEENYTDPSPEPSPDPSPSPAPMLDEQYLTTQFAIAPEGTGFNLDESEDGSIDNNLPVVLNTLNTELYNALVAALGQENADKLWAKLTEAGLILDVEVLNEFIQESISDGTLVYLESLSGPPADSTLAWFDGHANPSGDYVADQAIGTMDGSVTLSSGAGDYGPGTFTYEFTDTLALDVTNTLSTFVYTANEDKVTGTLTNGLLGGAILRSEVEELLRTALPDDQEEAIVDQVMAALDKIDAFDLTIDGAQAFSCAFTYSTRFQAFSEL